MAVIDINWQPDAKSLRSFGLICLAAFVGFGAWVFRCHSVLSLQLTPAAAGATAYSLWAVAALAGLLSLTFPRALYPLYIGLMIVSLPIGYLVSHLVMGLLFFGVFTPVALIFRAIGRDALVRRFEPDRKSYWVEREVIEDHTRYFRQY
jgi:hypothetical protein